ncbi:unnamed protein product [Calypogeia fissa]
MALEPVLASPTLAGQAQTSTSAPKISVGIPTTIVGSVAKGSPLTSLAINGSPTDSAQDSISKELILKDILKEKEHFVHENGLLRDHLARIVEQSAAQTDEETQSINEEDEDDEDIPEYGSKGSLAKSSFIGGGFSVQTSESEDYNISDLPIPKLNADERNDIASKENAKLHEEMDECRTTNERLLDELRAAYDESDLRIGEVRRDRADFQRDVMGDAQNKGFKRANAHKVLKFLEAKIKYKVAKAKKVHERNQALHVVIAQTGKQLGMKKELADVLHAVDFEQLHIHKQQNQQRLGDKSHELQRLKTSHAKALEALEITSIKLQDLTNNRNQTLLDLSNSEPQLAHVKKDISRVTTKKERLDELYHVFIQERDAQLGESQPNVLDYMQLKDQVHHLRREYKKWTNKVEVAELCSQQASIQSEKDATSSINGNHLVPCKNFGYIRLLS